MGQHVRLVMIVKNEAHVLARALASAKPLINSYCIVDTGSTDNTLEVARHELSGIPGEIHQREWVNFGVNRTESLELARADGVADYLLILDADDEFKYDSPFVWPDLDKEGYSMQIRSGSIRYPLVVMFKASLPWRYEGPLHAYPTLDRKADLGHLAGIYWHVNKDGARWSDPEKYVKGARVFEDQVKSKPDDTRSWFYLGQSWRDAGPKYHRQSIEAYQKRASMGGWQDEVFYSLYQVAKMKLSLGDPWPEVSQCFLEAYDADPKRAEPLFWVGMHHCGKKQWGSAMLFLMAAANLQEPVGSMFVESWVYQWGVLYMAFLALSGLKMHNQAEALKKVILGRENVPQRVRDFLTKNTEAPDAV